MSKEATKSIFSNRRDVLPIYKNNYEQSCNKAFKNCPVKTVITFEANNELLTNSNIDQWMHPVVNNIGLRVYSGNQYYKEFVGTLTCKFKDSESKETYFVLTTNEGKSINIIEYEYRTYYWVKNDDPNNTSATGLNSCN